MVPLRVPPQCDATCLVHWIRRVQRVRPAHGVVVKGLRSAKVSIVDAGTRWVLMRDNAVERRHLVEGAIGRAFGRRAVVADDVEEQRVVENAKSLERIDKPAEMRVDMLERTGVDLHLAREDGRISFGVIRPRPESRQVAASIRRPPGSRPASSGARRSPRAAYPSPDRTCPCICRSTPSARDAAHAVAPGAKYMKNGLSGISAFCWRVHLIALFVMSSVK